MDLDRRAPRPDAGRLVSLGLYAGWILLGLAVVLASQPLRPPAGNFPTALGLVMAAAAAIGLVRELRRASPALDLDRERVVRAGIFFAALWALWLAVLWLGLAVGGILWSVVMLRFVYGWTIPRSFVAALILVVVLVVLFSALGLEIPPGQVAKLLGLAR
ncbi:MAG TPA: hypothetical protein VFW92_02500 [Candidatus Limnocylindrales bacterium]|nr:hypothetical protein [Candidatus Limnocylindrales bacterium]